MQMVVLSTVSISIEQVTYRIFLLLFPILALIFHISLSSSVYNDSKRNVESNEDRWFLLTLFTGIIGLTLYILLVKRSEKNIDNFEVELLDSRILINRTLFLSSRLLGIGLMAYSLIIIMLGSLRYFGGGITLGTRLMTDEELVILSLPPILLAILLLIISSRIKSQGRTTR